MNPPPTRIILFTIIAAAISLPLNLWVYGWEVMLVCGAAGLVLIPLTWWTLRGLE